MSETATTAAPAAADTAAAARVITVVSTVATVRREDTRVVNAAAKPTAAPVTATSTVVTMAVVSNEAKDVIAIRPTTTQDRKSTRLNSSHLVISYAVFCL